MPEKLCPICGVSLKPRVVYDVEVDYCGRCGGVWLDGGELNKLVEMIKEYDKEYHEDREYLEFEDRYKKRKKKRSIFEMLEDLFEFG